MASQGSGSDGAPQSAGSMLSTTSTSTSSRRRDMASKLENATSLSIRVLQEITDNFSDKQKIGQGAYGMVYKAQLESGEEIAVKILYNTTQGINDVQFQREFENLMSLEHQNIVRLVGYCYETQHRPMQHKGKTIFTERIHRALCFEYMENGCLEKHISDERGGLDWHTRYKIIRGSWEGLKYLHEGFDEPMYHLDLKPENILLDESMTPKLADFGLSKLFNDKQTRITQSTMGTIGYLPREYLHGQTVSNKFDIFSLGVVMIKIIAGHGGNSRSADMPRQEFLDQVHENWKTRMLQTHGASRALGAYCKQVTICTDIALSCMEIDRHKRPTIEDIIRQLDETEDTINEALPSGTSTGTHSATKRDLVKLEALASSEAVPCGDSCDEYAILVRVTARPWRQAEEIARPGVDLVLVLDTMNDWRKFAMNRTMTKLGPNDRLAVVSGKGQCALDLTFMSDKDGDISRLMDEELPVEKPNMVDSVQEAAEILKKRQVEEGDSRLGFIIALSYERSWDPAWARMISQSISSQFPVHTLGLGMGHHKALKYVADQTSGTHSFTRAGGNDVIKDALELIIGGITKVAATSITITLTAHEGVAISSIESGGYRSRVNSEERRSGEIDITDIYAGETKKFIVKLKLPAGDMAKLLTIGGQYWSPNAASKHMLADTEVFVMRPRSVYAVAVTMETELSKKKKKKKNKRRGAPAVAVPPPPNWAIHHEVAAELVRVQLAKAVSAFPDVDRESIRSDIEGLWKKVRSSVEGKHAPQEALADLAEDMSEMEFNGKKLDYILSWLSSHQWQRATTKGGRSDSGAFMVQCNALSSTASTNSAIKGDLVKVEGLTSTNAVQSIEPWWEDGPLYPIMVRVTAPPRRRHAEEMRRAGVDLVLVLDLFDSYIQDTNKQAMTVLIHKLGPNDRLSVVSGRTVKLTLTSMSGKGRDIARLMVDERTDHFNMVDSVREASKILEGRPVEEGDSRLGFIMVLWHLGNKEPAILKQKISSQFPVHTLSVGPDDGYYGAEVGKYIADQTSGTYSFIEEGGLDEIKEALELFIGGITKVAATFITITIKAHPGVDISSIESGRYYSRMDYHYISGEIDIGDIYVGETKNFIVNLKLKQGEGKRKLLTIGGKYCSLNASTQWQRLADTEVCVLLPDSEGWSPEKVDIHPEVHAELVRVQIVKDLLTMLKADKRSFMADIDKLRKKITWVGEGDTNKTLAGIVKDIAEIEKDSLRYGRRKVPYVLSWLSCHEWQRATTKGLRSDSGAFMI